MAEAVTYITYEDVNTRNGEDCPQTKDVIERWINVAHAKLRALEPALDTRVETGSINIDMLEDVLIDCVWRRVQDDLIGWRVRSETWPENTTMFKDAEQSGIYFLDEELRDLGIDPEGQTRNSNVFSLFPIVRG